MSTQPDGPDPREHLRAIARALQDLHRVLLNYQRRDYERYAGRIASDFYLLTLAAEDPSFAWLRALSAEMMRVDILLAGKDEVDPVEVRLAGTRIRYLLTPLPNGNSFQGHYERAMPTNPEIIMAHASAMRALPTAPAVPLFRGEPATDIRTSADVPGVETRFHHPGNLVPGAVTTGTGALAAITEVILAPGTVNPSRVFANEDVLTWVPEGEARFGEDTASTFVVDARHPLVINAGAGLQLASSIAAPSEEAPLRMVQAFLRPSTVGGDPQFQHVELPDTVPGAWRSLAGPDGHDAPFHVRNNVDILDITLGAGEMADLPAREGWDTIFFLFDGVVEIDGVVFSASQVGLVMKPDSVRIVAVAAARLLAFVIDPAAMVTRAGSTAR